MGRTSNVYAYYRIQIVCVSSALSAQLRAYDAVDMVDRSLLVCSTLLGGPDLQYRDRELGPGRLR